MEQLEISQTTESTTKQCVYCKKRIDKEATVCPYCRKDPSQWTAWLKTTRAIITFIIVGYFIWLLYSCDSSFDALLRSVEEKTAEREIRRSESQHLPDDGDIISLNECNLCSDEATFDRLTQLSIAGDYAGINYLVSTGKAILIPVGTKAKIIDRGLFTTEVRITSGPHTGRYGFVATDAIW